VYNLELKIPPLGIGIVAGLLMWLGVAKGNTMEYLIGIFLALGISLGATAVGFDRERSFYPTVLIVIALLYALFAIMAGSTLALLLELLPAALFVIAAVSDFKTRLWWFVAGLIGHGLFDFRARSFHSESRRSGVLAWVLRNI
jgi:hypothetical protein